MKKFLFGFLLFFSFSFLLTQASYSETELQKAITWMYENELTIYNNPEDFMSNNPINREQASKFFWVIAENIYKKWKTSTINCSFNDIKKADPTLQTNIIDACKLGIFRWYKQNFDPKRQLSNAEGLAVLTRIVDYTPSENQNPWYKKYYDMIMFRWIIDVDWLRLKDEWFAQQKATRWEIALMIYKTYNKKINKGQQKEEMENPYEKIYQTAYPELLNEYSIEFSHDFTNAPSLTEDKKQMIRTAFNLAFGNALYVMKNWWLINQTDIDKIKWISIDHFDWERTMVWWYCKTISRSVTWGGVINSFGWFGYATYPNNDVLSLEEYYKSPYIQHIFYHEVWHYIDLVKNQWAREFWEICWTNLNGLEMEGSIKSQCNEDAFVEEYGMTMPVEDFATAFAINFYPKISYSYTRNNLFLKEKFTFLNSLINKIYPEIISCPTNQHVEYGICEPNQRACIEWWTYWYQQRDSNSLSWSSCILPSTPTWPTTNNSNDPCLAPKDTLTYAVMCKDENGCRVYDQHFEDGQCVKNSTSSISSTWSIIPSTWSTASSTNCSIGQHKENDICISNNRTCTVDNGIWEQIWIGSHISWIGSRWPCSNLSCNEWYSVHSISVSEPWMYEFHCELLCQNWYHQENGSCSVNQRYCTTTDNRQWIQCWTNNIWDTCRNGCSSWYQLILMTWSCWYSCIIP